jgi:hypothetical protein
MIKKMLVVLVVLLVVGGFFLLDRKQTINPHYEVIANHITLDTAELLKERYGLNVIGIGGGMMDDIKKMNLSLQSRKPLSINEGRDFIVMCIDTYLDQINSNKKVRPFLNAYPFTIENIEIKIFIDREEGENLAIGRLAVVSTHGRKIKYKVVESEFRNEEVLSETYEEAREIVMAGQSPAIAR